MSELKSSQIDHNGQPLDQIMQTVESDISAAEYTHPATHDISMITNGRSATEITAEIQAAIAAVIDGAPGALDTLKEISDSLAANPDLASVVDAKSMFKIINGTFPSGNTSYVVSDAFIVEATCKVDIMPEGDTSGSWSGEYVDGQVTITSTEQEAAPVNFRVYVLKQGAGV